MTKKYGDEAIIKMRRAYQKLKYNSLSTGIFVKEQLISFREQEIDSLGTRMILPEVMEPMEEEPQKKGLPMAAIIGIIVGVIAVIVIVVVIISKKKKAKKQKEDMDLLDGDDV